MYICVYICALKERFGGKTLNKLLRINRKGWGKGQAVEKKKEDICTLKNPCENINVLPG